MKNDEKQYRKWLDRMLTKYQPVLFLQQYDVKFQRKDADRNYLSSEFNYPYLEATVFYSGNAIADLKKDPARAERRIIHEFCHIITDAFYYVAVERYVTKTEMENARERLTDLIANVVRNTIA